MDIRMGSWVWVTETDRAVWPTVARPVYHDLEGTVIAVNADGTFDVVDEFEQVFDSVPAANVRRACRTCNAVLESAVCSNCGEKDRG
jgi:hypothetical protein